MRIKAIFNLMLAFGIMLSGCNEHDNFEPPKSTLTGRVVYNGQPLSLRSGGVQLELWQKGYAFREKIPVFVAQDGSYSATLFDGDYKLVLLRGNGPWVDNSDSIDVQLRGSTNIDVPVQPYYVIENEQFQRNGNNVTVSLNVREVTPGRQIERITYYLGKTTIVDAGDWAAVTDIWWPAPESLANVQTLTLGIPAALANKGYVYARVGIKMAGIEEMIYAPTQKIQIN
ncbi:DUF3823 domain-containing protein [Rufibacter aurantiacus]|uniref:DUF3823 domain-containing protein n=1 Tax=Rufibacter aurantiacus TaxID=2817374 RepID=UPI001FEF6120|nr:DUF3823 domain-containing protein [Rufibacter aurantiacus]